MPQRPPQGRGSGGRVTPSSKTRATPGGGRAGRGGDGRSAAKTSAERAKPGTRSKKPSPPADQPSGTRRRARVPTAAERKPRRGSAVAEAGSAAKAKGSTTDGASEGRRVEEARAAAPATVTERVKALFAPTGADYVPAPERTRPWWGSGDVLLWFVIAQFAFAVAYYVAVAMSGYATGWPIGDGARAGEVVGRMAAGQAPSVTPTPADLPLWVSQGVVLLPMWAAFIGGPIYVAWRKGLGVVTDFKLAITARDVPLGLALGAIAQLVWNPLIYKLVFTFTGVQDVSARARDLTSKATTPAAVVFLFVTVAFVVPVAEELFFRGLTLQSFTKRLGPLWALVLSSLFFALVHGDLIFLPALFPFAALLAWLVQRYDRLGPAICTHVAYNLVTAATLVWNLSIPWL